MPAKLNLSNRILLSWLNCCLHIVVDPAEAIAVNLSSGEVHQRDTGEWQAGGGGSVPQGTSEFKPISRSATMHLHFVMS